MQRELRSPARTRDILTACSDPPSSGVTSSASAIQLPALQRLTAESPPRYSASTGDFTTVRSQLVRPQRAQVGSEVMSVQPKNVAHRGSLLSLAVLLAAAARRPSAPHILDDSSAVSTTSGLGAVNYCPR